MSTATSNPVAKVVLEKPGATGLAVIVTNDDYSKCPLNLCQLPGADKDGKSLFQALSGLNFAVHWVKNINELDMQWLIHDIGNLKLDMVKGYSCIFFIFAGHGCEGDRLRMSDGKEINVGSDIVDRLMPENAKEIGDVPKIYLIDACRGESRTEAVMVPRTRSSTNCVSETESRGGNLLETLKVAGKGEFILAYSTIPRHKAYEVKEGGVWLSTLAEQLNKREHLDSVDNLLTSVNALMKDRFQDCDFFQQPEKIHRMNQIISIDPNGGGARASTVSMAADASGTGKTKHCKIAANFNAAAALSSGTAAIQYTQLLSRYARSQGLKETYSDSPFYAKDLNHTYYSSCVTLTGQGGDTCAKGTSTQGYCTPELAREDAAKTAYQSLMSQQQASNSPERVGQGASDQAGTRTCTTPVSIAAILNEHCQKYGGSIKSDFIEDHSSSSPIFKCSITCMVQGRKVTRDSGTFFPRKDDAKEMAAYNVCSTLGDIGFEWSQPVQSHAATATTSPKPTTNFVSRLKEHYEKQYRPVPEYKVLARVSGEGFVARVYVVELGKEVEGEVARNKKEAKQNAARKALHRLNKY